MSSRRAVDASPLPAPAAAASEASDVDMTSVARLYYLDGLGQQKIAEMLGLSRSTISRLLTAARERGIVRISVDPYDPRDATLEARLCDRFGLRYAVVIRGAGRTAETARRTVGYFAAGAVAERFQPGQTIGLAGGRSLYELIHAFAAVRPAPRPRVVQLMGSIGPTTGAIDSTELSRVLAGRLDGTFFTLNAPAFASDRRTRDAFVEHEHLRTVRELFGALDLALVGIGSLDESAFVAREALGTADVAMLRRAGAVGEVCGRFFDRSGRECDTKFRHRVISIELDELRRCPEIVAVANGPRRARALLAALQGGLVNSLVIDQQGAEALLAEGDPR
ncbi:MAG: sugar-binding transcriptional regulator [Burkholderiales bacterium]|nr:sugar-binding transcriptional regulator [Burkholderiales bacterium]